MSSVRKLQLYLETSVWSHLLAEDTPEKKAVTEALFREIEAGKYEVFVSDLVLAEVDETPDRRRRRSLLNSLKKYSPVELEIDEEADQLSRWYLDEGALPPSAADDAVHAAVAVVNGLDVLVSWNMDHLVSVRARQRVNGVNRLRGYRDIEIATPEEVLGYGGD